MKSGNTKLIEYDLKINLNQYYADLHDNEECKGEWQLTLTTGPSRRLQEFQAC